VSKGYTYPMKKGLTKVGWMPNGLIKGERIKVGITELII